MQTISANVNNNTALGAPNDIYLDSRGNLSLSFDIQAALEACAEAAKTILGEMVLNTDQGIPYFQTVWVGVPNLQQFNSALRVAFLNVPNVIEVVTLTSEIVNNPAKLINSVLTYTAVIRTNFGSSGFSGSITGTGEFIDG
jgi:hypothetical protein